MPRGSPLGSRRLRIVGLPTPLKSARFTLVLLALLASSADSLRASTILWLGGDGVWSDPLHWNCSCGTSTYPNNSPVMDYYVTIDPGIAAGITLDVSPT